MKKTIISIILVIIYTACMAQQCTTTFERTKGLLILHTKNVSIIILLLMQDTTL